MKKLFFALFAVVLCLGMTSCGGSDLKSIVEKAKTEGANWSVDEWKAQYKAAMQAVKPMLLDLKDLQEKIQKDPSKAADLMKEATALQEKYSDVSKLMEELDEAAKATENGKKVADDDEFVKQVLKELGLDDIDF